MPYRGGYYIARGAARAPVQAGRAAGNIANAALNHNPAGPNIAGPVGAGMGAAAVASGAVVVATAALTANAIANSDKRHGGSPAQTNPVLTGIIALAVGIPLTIFFGRVHPVTLCATIPIMLVICSGLAQACMRRAKRASARAQVKARATPPGVPARPRPRPSTDERLHAANVGARAASREYRGTGLTLEQWAAIRRARQDAAMARFRTEQARTRKEGEK